MDFHAALGLGLPIGIGIAAIGSGFALGVIGNGAMQAIGRQPEATPKIQLNMIIIAALAEALTIYAFVTMFLLQGKISG
jgi:F-type H+-transporting ATPase subunit c